MRNRQKLIQRLTWLVVIVLLLAPGLAYAEGSEIYLPMIFTPQTSSVANAALQSYPWQNHAPPFDLLFGNRMDQHQQSKSEGQDRLSGFLYIDFTGETNEDGVPKAKHVNCNEPNSECTVGWTLQGIQRSATLLEQGEGGPPQWCIDEESWPIAQGYTHFHWIREGGGAGEGEHSGLQVGEEYTGYLIKLTARTTFVFQHAGEHDQGGEPGGPPTDPGGDHDDGGCGDDSGHEEGGCGGDDGGHEEDGGCGGDDGGHEDDGSNCAHKGVLVSPGIDFVSHANVTTCQ